MAPVNIVLFGETGVGKSSVINLIAGRTVASVSPDAPGRTLYSTQYNFAVNGRSYNVWDTAGLEQPEMGTVEYMAAIEGVLSLIQGLSKQGGLDLLLFCIRGGRITSTTQSNYRLFYEVLCKQKVPIALAITNLEREEPDMEAWWARNLLDFGKYGIKAAAHACVTGLPSHRRYRESKVNIERMLKEYDGQGKYNMPADTWFVEFLRFFGPYARSKKDLNKSDLVKVLTKRCRMKPKIAQELAGRLIRPKDVDNDPPSVKLPSNSPAQPQVDTGKAPLSEGFVVPGPSHCATQEPDVQPAPGAGQGEPREMAKFPQPSLMRRKRSEGIRLSDQQTLLSPHSPSNPPSRAEPPARATTEAPAQPHEEPVSTHRVAQGSGIRPVAPTSGAYQEEPREMAELPQPSSMRKEKSEGIHSSDQQTPLSPHNPPNPPPRAEPQTRVTTEAPAQSLKEPVPELTRRTVQGSSVRPTASASGAHRGESHEMAELPQSSPMREKSEGIHSSGQQIPLSPHGPSNPPSRAEPPTRVTTEAPAQPRKEPIPGPTRPMAQGSDVRPVASTSGVHQEEPRETAELPQPSSMTEKSEGIHSSGQQTLLSPHSPSNPSSRSELPTREAKVPLTNAETDPKKRTHRASRCCGCVLM